MIQLSDISAEKAVLAGICQYGAEAYYEIMGVVEEDTFTVDSNQHLFRCVEHIIKQDDSRIIDDASILSASKELEIDHILSRRDEMRHMQAIIHFPVQLDNVRHFAAKIKKLQLARILCDKLDKAKENITQINGTETIADILNIAENSIFTFSSSLNENYNAPELLGDHIVEYIKHLEDNPVQQIGISTGFKIYDKVIGGGVRPGTINVIAARPKIGKTVLADNFGIHIARNNIPVLNLDTEMIKRDHIHRCVACISGVGITEIETGQFARNPDKKNKVIQAAQELATLPYSYKNIGGLAFEDQMSIARNWLIKTVKLNRQGQANPCVIIYDYIKMMTADNLSKSLQEYQALGFLMTSLHNFALKYYVPIIAMCQLNRDGITKETTDVASGSDRIIWLCSNFTIFKQKSDEEIADDGADAGNRKLVPLVSRHGAGLEDRDYINCHMQDWCSKITEKKTHSELHDHDDTSWTADADIQF